MSDAKVVEAIGQLARDLIAAQSRIAELEAAIATIAGEPCADILAHVVGLVRLVGPDDWPADAVSRDAVVDMAMPVKRAADEQRRLARAVLAKGKV